MKSKSLYSSYVFIFCLLLISNVAMFIQLHEIHSEAPVDYWSRKCIVQLLNKSALTKSCPSQVEYNDVCGRNVQEYSNFIDYYEEMMKVDNDILFNKTTNTVNELVLLQRVYEYLQHVCLVDNNTSGFIIKGPLMKRLNQNAKESLECSRHFKDCMNKNLPTTFNCFFISSELKNINCDTLLVKPTNVFSGIFDFSKIDGFFDDSFIKSYLWRRFMLISMLLRFLQMDIFLIIQYLALLKLTVQILKDKPRALFTDHSTRRWLMFLSFICWYQTLLIELPIC